METELEKLIVTLTGEASEYMGMMQQAQTSTQQTVEKVEKGAARIEELGNHLKSFASSAMSALATLGLSIGIAGAFNKFNEMEEGMIRLNVAIESNGGNVQAAAAQYVKFAEQIERTTELSKGQVIGMIRQAETMGMAGAAAERTTRFAIGFASALQMAPEHAMTLAIAMERGNVHMLRRIPALRGITNEQELLKKAQEISNQGMKISNELSQTAAGRLAKMQQSIGKLAKDIGGLVADALLPVINYAKQIVDWFNSLDKGTRRIVAGVLLAVAAVPALTAAWGYLSTVLGTVTMAFQAVRVAMMLAASSTGVGIALVAIGLAIAFIVEKAGGWAVVWDNIQSGASQLWEDIKAGVSVVWPILDALWQSIKAAWTNVISPLVEVYLALWAAQFIAMRDVVLGVWNAITGGAEVDWKAIGEFFSDLMLKIEFGIRNAGIVWQYVWGALKLTTVTLFEMLSHLFRVNIPEAALWAVDYILTQLYNLLNLGTTAIGNLVGNVVRLITSIPGLIQGTVNWADIWRPLTEGFDAAIARDLNLTERQFTELEHDLRAEWEATGLAMNESWEDFRRQRLEGMAEEARAAEASDNRDSTLQKNKKDRHLKVDAALSGSAEALARFAEFQDKMSEERDRSMENARQASAAGANASRGGGLGGALGNIANMGQGILQGIQETLAVVWQNIEDAAVEFWTWLTTLPGAAWDAATEFFTTTLPGYAVRIWNSASEFFTTTLPALAATAWTSAVNFFTRSVPAFFTEVVPNILAVMGTRAELFFSSLLLRTLQAMNNILPQFAQINLEGAEQRHTELERRVENRQQADQVDQGARRETPSAWDEMIDVMRRIQENTARAAAMEAEKATNEVGQQINLIVTGLQ